MIKKTLIFALIAGIWVMPLTSALASSISVADFRLVAPQFTLTLNALSKALQQRQIRTNQENVLLIRTATLLTVLGNQLQTPGVTLSPAEMIILNQQLGIIGSQVGAIQQDRASFASQTSNLSRTLSNLIEWLKGVVG